MNHSELYSRQHHPPQQPTKRAEDFEIITELKLKTREKLFFIFLIIHLSQDEREIYFEGEDTGNGGRNVSHYWGVRKGRNNCILTENNFYFNREASYF